MLTLAANNPTEGTLLAMAVLIPTLAFVAMCFCGVCGALNRRSLYRFPAWITTAAIGGCFLVSLVLCSELPKAEKSGGFAGVVVPFFDWINIGGFSANFSFYIDSLTIVMLFVVTGVGTLISWYAAWYMDGDDGYWRFFAYIALFIFAMSCLVMADNLLLLYLGWEGVGAASYLLIGYYYRKPSAVAAAKKAFIVNRVGDFGFALGLMGVFVVFGTVSYTDIFQLSGHGGFIEGLPAWQQTLVLWIPFLLMLGAFGKSAQLPLHVWLPDAMEGPTPVSALIHAATMVTAGVYMIARLLPVFELSPYALPVVAVIGCVTAFFAATIALCQYDLKRVWAYSTVSQLGYMFLGVGMMSSFGAIFHLFTHAFFKALLFLTAGTVMHALAGQLDLRQMSGLRHKMPWTAWLMFVGCLALAGAPFTSGFFSKDEILVAALVEYPALGAIGMVTALLTAFYTFRLWFHVFCGEERYEMGREHHGYEIEQGHAHKHDDDDEYDEDDEHAHAPHEPHDPPIWATAPLIVLAAGALFAGLLLKGFMHTMIDASSAYVEPHGDHSTLHMHVGGAAGGGAILMIGLAYLLYGTAGGRRFAHTCSRAFAPLVTALHRKYYVDELYDLIICKPLRGLGWVCYRILDQFGLDRTVIDGVLGGLPRAAGWIGAQTQRGALQGYALIMGMGLVILLILLAWNVMAG